MPDDLTALSDEQLADELVSIAGYSLVASMGLKREAARRLTRTCGRFQATCDATGPPATYCYHCGGKLVEETSDDV